MTHKRPQLAAPSAPQMPQQKAAQTRRIRRAAREAEAREAQAREERLAAEESLVSECPPAQPPALASADTPAHPPPLDAHGFDPADYKWLPVKRKPRKDGWTPQRQREFIASLAETGSVEAAANRVQMSASSAHRLRRSPGAEQFSAAWDVALQHAARVLLDVAFDRAFRGTTEPVFDRDGHKVGERFRQNDRLLMFLLRAYMPDRFRHAHRDWRAADEALPPAPEPMADALLRLEPVPPAEPHRLLPPDELEDAVAVADMLDGELPHYHRGKGDAEDAPAPDPAFEAELERLRREDEDEPRDADSA